VYGVMDDEQTTIKPLAWILEQCHGQTTGKESDPQTGGPIVHSSGSDDRECRLLGRSVGFCQDQT